MTTVSVVGSGPSGVHFAEALVDQGHRVRLFDVGVQGPEPVHPDVSLEQLKDTLNDPVSYFLGNELQALIQPDYGAEYYGLPPSKDYVFRAPEQQPLRTQGFEPLLSWARGGLAQAWTGGSYPFNEEELAEFPFGFQEIAPFYDEVADRIGISGATDDLSRFIPVHAHMGGPLDLDGHSIHLERRYKTKRERLKKRLRLHLGRSRIAVLSTDRVGRQACSYLGRCIWGCPKRSLYTPSMTLEALRGRTGFEYLPDRLVRRFRFDQDGWVRSIVWTSPEGGPEYEESVEVLALAAGTLSSARIFLESWREGRGEDIRLAGLMDNRQVMVPFLSPGRIGKPFEPDSYQYNLLAMGLEGDHPEEYVHCLVTTLTTALVHPIIQSLPLDLRTATWVFRNIRAALGIVNVNFHDRRRDDCYVGLASSGPSSAPELQIQYRPRSDESQRVNEALVRLKKGLRALGAIVPPGMSRYRPMGASAHYAGTLPMTRSPGPLTTDLNCKSRDFGNLYLVDGSTFPFLPAKNLTFTLMANARRVARNAFGAGGSAT